LSPSRPNRAKEGSLDWGIGKVKKGQRPQETKGGTVSWKLVIEKKSSSQTFSSRERGGQKEGEGGGERGNLKRGRRGKRRMEKGD